MNVAAPFDGLGAIVDHSQVGWEYCRLSEYMGKPTELVQGTLDLLILKTISLEPKHGWIKAHWAETETGRKAKFYSLTRAGRAQMEKEMASWDRLSAAINLVVKTV